MTADDPAIITREQLVRKLETVAPSNEDAREGYALVNVLGPDAFERERIPGSINIPAEELDAFEKRFRKGKEVIVYCASPSCEASEKVAQELSRRGFQRVVDYKKGLSDWKEGGQAVSGRSA